MEIKLKLEVYDLKELEDKIENFECIRQEHISNFKCKEPNSCEVLSDLDWFLAQLRNIKRQVEKALEEEFEYKSEV
tara:strand:- start:91 stop:318 length:228 start_codon:yes stop_codon:yes gene_type:complete